MIEKHRRSRSIEVSSIYRLRNANRVEDLARVNFQVTATPAAFDRWSTAIRNVQRARAMRCVATQVTVRRSRHALSLCELRTGVDAYSTYRNTPPGSCADLANDDSTDRDRLAENDLDMIEEPHTFALSPDDFSLDEAGAHAPPSTTRRSFPNTGGPPT